jgi:hypothetical protein
LAAHSQYIVIARRIRSCPPPAAVEEFTPAGFFSAASLAVPMTANVTTTSSKSMVKSSEFDVEIFIAEEEG